MVWRFLLIMVATIAGDQLVKFWVVRHFDLYQSKVIIPGFFNLTYLTNTGAAFGILAGRPALWRNLLFAGIVVLALLVIAILQYRVGRSSAWYTSAFALVAGGAVGNLIDRIRLGSVIDFLDFYVGPYHWPAFNVADSAITVGAALLVILSVVRSEPE